MEQLNRVTLRGTVGSIRTEDVCGRTLARMTVATNYAYRAKDGSCVLEVTWHNVSAWEGGGVCPLGEISKGDRVQLEGRIRNRRYTGADGSERFSTEIVAVSLEKLPSDGPMDFEM